MAQIYGSIADIIEDSLIGYDLKSSEETLREIAEVIEDRIKSWLDSQKRVISQDPEMGAKFMRICYPDGNCETRYIDDIDEW